MKNSDFTQLFINKNWLIGILASLCGGVVGVVILLSSSWVSQRFDYQENMMKARLIQYEEDLKTVKMDLKTILTNTSTTNGDLRVLSIRINSLEQAMSKIYSEYFVQDYNKPK